jgi:outer membrane autotransporter protein
MEYNMSKMIHTGLSAGPLALIAAAAVLAANPCAATEKFNGFYVGGDFGYESSGRTSKDGWTFGGFAGFNLKATDRLVIGGEVRLADSTIKEQLRTETTSTIAVANTNIGRSIGLAARLGYIVGERTMIYGRAGWEDTRLNAVRTVTPKPPTTNPNPVTTDFSFNDDSLTLGVGVEHHLTDTISLRLGYDWAENFDRHQLRAGVAFNF